MVMAWSVDRLGPSAAGPRRLPVRDPRARDRPVPASAGHRHHDAGRQGDVPDDGRVRRVRARMIQERVRAALPGRKRKRDQERQSHRTATHGRGSKPSSEATIAKALQKGKTGIRKIARQHGRRHRHGAADRGEPGARHVARRGLRDAFSGAASVGCRLGVISAPLPSRVRRCEVPGAIWRLSVVVRVDAVVLRAPGRRSASATRPSGPIGATVPPHELAAIGSSLLKLGPGSRQCLSSC